MTVAYLASSVLSSLSDKKRAELANGVAEHCVNEAFKMNELIMEKVEAKEAERHERLPDNAPESQL